MPQQDSQPRPRVHHSGRRERPFLERSWSGKILHHLSVPEAKWLFEEVPWLRLSLTSETDFESNHHGHRTVFRIRNTPVAS
jgi:hypothetical protein